MPSDIRSFFGGKPAAGQAPASSPKQSVSTVRPHETKTRLPKKGGLLAKCSTTATTRRALQRFTQTDARPARKPAPPPAKKRARSPEPEVSKDDYFGKSKPKRAAAASKTATPQQSPAKSKATPRSAKSQASAGTPRSRSTRTKAAVSYEEDAVDEPKTLADDDEGDDDIYADNKKAKDDYQESSDSDVEMVPKPANGTKKAKAVEPDADDDDDFMEVEKPKATTGRKRKSAALDDDEDEKPKKKAAPTASKKAKQEPVEDSAEVKAILDGIPLIQAPPPPDRETDGKFKFDPRAKANQALPAAAGSKELPIGQPNCLAGLSFVFTGLLESLGREEGQELVKRYGGKIVGAPSSKTSYVVLGSDAGPKKLETIAKANIKTINEDGLFELIRRMPANGGDSKAGAAYAQKEQAEMDKIKAQAAQMEKEERATDPGTKTSPVKSSAKAKAEGPDTRLWTVKYSPASISQVCGNKKQVETLQNWLRNFPKNLKRNFKLGGPDGTGGFRAIIISGPPGIGKTTAAHLVAKVEGYDIVETNASDTRSKKLVESGLRGVLDTTSLVGYFGGGGQAQKSKRNLVLIMDEVDGMSAGDRGGVGALATICRTSSVPMILICNDRKQPKMKPFDRVAFDLPFRRPTTDMIRGRVMTIAFREGMKLAPPVVNALIEGTGADIRQVINMLSAAKVDNELSQQDMNFDDSKAMSKAWEKHTVLKPWDLVSKILGGGLFAPASKSTLNEKIELYFNDHEFSSLMLQENYLGTKPHLLGPLGGRQRQLKELELYEQAANSISEGDLVDRMIHGSQQQWSLMPTHAVMSFVRPASFVYGTLSGGGGINFTSWLGKNSNQQKLLRMVKEIQGHMRLRCSADKNAIRQLYLPALWPQLVARLKHEGKDAVPKVIELMDSYFLTKEDWDAIVELGIGPMAEEHAKIETQTKATFTRLYNAKSHPMPYMKASSVLAPKKAARDKPDLEEAFEEEDEAVEEEVKEEDEDEAAGDISKDKYVRQPKKKGAKAAKKDEDDDEDEGGKKPKAKGRASKGKGK